MGFNPEVPLAVRFFLVIIIGVGLLILVGMTLGWLFGRNKEYSPDGGNIGIGRGIKRALIWIAQIAAVLQVIFFTIAGGVIGSIMANLYSLRWGINAGTGSAELFGFICGAVSAFLGTVVWAALIFTIAETERNTRITAIMLQRIVTRNGQ